MSEAVSTSVTVTLTTAGQDDEADAICEILDGDQVVVQPFGNALDRILLQANEDRMYTRLLQCKFITYTFALICWVCTMFDVVFSIVLSIKTPNVLIAEKHTWGIEGPLLVLQAILAVFLSTFATQIIIREIRISTKCYFICLAGLILVVSIISGWIFKEDTHGHYLKSSVSATRMVKDRIQYQIKHHPKGLAPAWLEQFQKKSNCCGLDSINDWSTLWEKPDVPDSCCIKYFKDCGQNIFHQSQYNMTQIVNFLGCKDSSSSFSSNNLLLMEQVKFMEAFLMIFVTLIWLCCWDKFIAQDDQELLIRYAQPRNDNGVRSNEPSRPNPNDESHDQEESASTREPLHVVAVDSRHNQIGGGDLGIKSEVTLTPKTQHNYQSGDYTEIDPTKAPEHPHPIDLIH